MVARTKADLSAHFEFRRTTLAAAAEWMFAALQLHVEGCPRCQNETCCDATHASVKAVRDALARDWAEHQQA
jgi:hypothetical protein